MDAAEKQAPKKKRLNVLRTTSEKKGILGAFETFIRSFRTLAYILCLIPIVFICTSCLAMALVPSIYLFHFILDSTATWPQFLHYTAMGFAIALGYLTYGVCLIFIVPFMNKILPLKVKPWKGIWYSVQTIPWYIHNALTYLVRYTFLEFVTPTPLNLLFYRMMGMKIGKGVVINTTNISDPCLITIEDYVTVGGSAHIFAHYGQKGILILSPVTIKKGATIGLKASIMGGVTVGEGATVKPHTVLLPKEKVPDGAVV